MSWIYLPGQQVEYLEQNTYSDGKRLSTSKKTKANKRFSKPESATDSLTTLPSGQTFAASASEITNVADSFATSAKFVASLWLSGVFHVSRLVWPVGCWPKTTIETGGLTPFVLLEKSGQHGYFWRTFQDCLLAHTGITAQFSETWPRAGTMQDGVCYRLPKWERRINEIGYGLLPTPVATDGSHGGYNRSTPTSPIRPSLAMMARHNLWRTPQASDGTKGGPNQRDSSGALHLSAQAQKWRSPNAHNWKNGSTSAERKGHTIGLNDQVMWPTPVASEGMKGSANGSKDFLSAHVTWPTPKSTRRGDCPSERNRRSPDLPSAVNMWPTPLAGSNSNRRGVSEKSGDGLATAVKTHPTPSPTDYRTGYRTDTEAGIAQREKRSKPLRPEAAPGGQLNPDWVEWLMGWPIGWTSTEPLPETAVTEWLEGIQSGKWWGIDPADVGDVPRTRTNIPERVARLFATGNGQVPVVSVLAWLLLMEAV